jgi:hypothetical protein
MDVPTGGCNWPDTGGFVRRRDSGRPPNLFSLVRRRSSMWWRVLQDSNPGGFRDGLAAGCDPPAIPRRAPPSRCWTTPYRPCGCMIYGARYANRLPARWRHGIGRQRVQRHTATQVRRRSQRRAPKAPGTLAPAARRTSDPYGCPRYGRSACDGARRPRRNRPCERSHAAP